MLRASAVVLAAVLPLSWGLPPALRLAWTAAVVGALLGLLLTGRARLGPGSGVWLAATYLAGVATVVSAAHAVDRATHVQNGVLLVAVWGLAPPVLRWAAGSRPDLLRAAATGLVLGQTASSLVAVAQSVTGGAVLGSAAELGRAPGLAGHSNVLGLLAAVAIVLCLGDLRTARTVRRRAALALLVAANAGGLLASASMTALAALALGSLVLAVALRVRLRWVVLAVASLAALVTALASLAPGAGSFRTPAERLLQVTGQTDQISTMATRLETVQAAWEGIRRDALVGVGLDDASGVTSIVLDGETLTHDLPLRAWYQGGLALVLAVVLVYLHVARGLVLAMRRGVAATEASVLGVMLSFALTSATLQQPYFWLVATAASASLSASRARLRARDEPRGAARPAVRTAPAVGAPAPGALRPPVLVGADPSARSV